MMPSLPIILAALPPPPSTPPPRTCKKRRFSSPVFPSVNSVKKPVRTFADFLRPQKAKLHSSTEEDIDPSDVLLLKGRYSPDVQEDKIIQLNNKLHKKIPTLSERGISNDLRIHRDRTFTIVLRLPEGASLKAAMKIAQEILIQEEINIT